MKYIVTTILLCLTMTVAAQRGNDHRGNDHQRRAPLSPEQHATLTTKKMTLTLDLTTQQVDKVYKVRLEQAQKREAFMAERKKEDRPELTKEQRFELETKKLDHRIAIQREMKSILTTDQFELWRKMNHKNKQKRKGKHHTKRK